MSSAAPSPKKFEKVQEKPLLEQIVDQIAQSKDERPESKSWVETLLNEVVSEKIRVQDDTEAMLAQRIKELDDILTAQVNEILQLPEVKSLEATWRGLHYLTQQTETSPMLKIKVLNVNRTDLVKDLRNAVEFDQSQLFKKVYEEEYGVHGGQPFGLLVGDYEFDRTSEDLEILQKASGVAAAAHAPFIAAAKPGMFGWSDYTELNNNRDLAKIFDTELYTKWRMFRESEDSRYVGLTLPHILLREPYGPENVRVEAFQFDEKVDGSDHSKYLWGNAAYALAARITDSFSQHNWCLSIRGVEGGGLVEGLPVHTFKTEDGEINLKCPTEIAIPHRREKEFADLGFVPLCHEKHSDRAVFFGVQSCQKPKKYHGDNASANAELSAQLQYILAASRFAHYLKAIAYDKIGSFTSRAEAERFFGDWIANYVLDDDTASQVAKARQPLREARVEVADVPGKPGQYKAIAYLRPHFQLDALTASLRLVAELPAATKR